MSKGTEEEVHDLLHTFQTHGEYWSLGGQKWADELTTSHSEIKWQPDSSDNETTWNHN